MFPLDRVVVVAGPACCGKSKFIRRLRSGDLGDISSTLKIDRISDWSYLDVYYLNARQLKDIEHSNVRRMLLHWTIPTPTIRLKLRNLLIQFTDDKKERLELLGSTIHLTVLTLFTSRESLLCRVQSRRARLLERRHSGMDDMISHLRRMWEVKILERHYSVPGNIERMYNQWFRLCESLDISDMHLVDLENEPLLVPKEKWPEITE
jgi:hypothetical protein